MSEYICKENVFQITCTIKVINWNYQIEKGSLIFLFEVKDKKYKQGLILALLPGYFLTMCTIITQVQPAISLFLAAVFICMVDLEALVICT